MIIDEINPRDCMQEMEGRLHQDESQKEDTDFLRHRCALYTER